METEKSQPHQGGCLKLIKKKWGGDSCIWSDFGKGGGVEEEEEEENPCLISLRLIFPTLLHFHSNIDIKKEKQKNFSISNRSQK